LGFPEHGDESNIPSVVSSVAFLTMVDPKIYNRRNGRDLLGSVRCGNNQTPPLCAVGHVWFI
jgi:hypothetical protein